MKTWFSSLKGTVTISVLALLSFIGYVMMEMRYFLAKWIPGDTAAALETFFVLLIVAGWMRALYLAANGSRGALTALLIFGVFNALIGIYDFQFIPMPWPEQTMVIAAFAFGLVSIAMLVMQLKQKK